MTGLIMNNINTKTKALFNLVKINTTFVRQVTDLLQWNWQLTVKNVCSCFVFFCFTKIKERPPLSIHNGGFHQINTMVFIEITETSLIYCMQYLLYSIFNKENKITDSNTVFRDTLLLTKSQ